MAGKLTAKEFPTFKAWMDRSDSNGDGKIQCSELSTMKAVYNVSEEQIKDVFAEADADANGSLDFPEFMRAYGIVLKRRLTDKDNRIAINDAFFTFAENMTMSPNELGQLMKVLGENMTEEEIAKMIKDADLDKDGKFSLTEFKKVMENKYRK